MKQKLLVLFLYVIVLTTCLFIYQYKIIKNETGDFLPPEKVNIPGIKTTSDFLRPKNVDNIPGIYFVHKTVNKAHNKTCAKFPKIWELQFSVDPWQIQKISNGTLHLYSAYVDDRGEWFIRIMAMLNLLEFNQTLYCQFWFEKNTKPIIVQSTKPLMVWYKVWSGNRTDLYFPYIISCPLPWVKIDRKIPMSVSLVEKACDNSTNNLRVNYKPNVGNKKNFVVCVKGLNFPFDDITFRLVEWIELISLLGADKIHFYNFKVHPETEKVLDYYKKRNLVEVVPLTLIGGASNNPHLQTRYLRGKAIERRLQEVLPYNDCLYKHLQEFKYVAVLDIDEVIVPKNGTWVDLLKNLETGNNGPSSFMARNVYFLDSFLHNHTWFDDIPEYMHILQHVYRSENYSKPGWYVKGFHNLSKILALHNHYPFRCIDECDHFDIDPEDAHLQHYRHDCVITDSECKMLRKKSVMDTRVWNFKNLLIERVQKVIKSL